MAELCWSWRNYSPQIAYKRMPICRMHNYSWCLASLWAPETAPTATPAANDAHSGSSSSCISRSGGWEETTTHGVWDEEETIVPLGGCCNGTPMDKYEEGKKAPTHKGRQEELTGYHGWPVAQANGTRGFGVSCFFRPPRLKKHEIPNPPWLLTLLGPAYGIGELGLHIAVSRRRYLRLPRIQFFLKKDGPTGDRTRNPWPGGQVLYPMSHGVCDHH